MVGGGVREFVYDADEPAFLKRNWWDLVWIGTSRSEFMIKQVVQCPFIHFKSI